MTAPSDRVQSPRNRWHVRLGGELFTDAVPKYAIAVVLEFGCNLSCSSSIAVDRAELFDLLTGQQQLLPSIDHTATATSSKKQQQQQEEEEKAARAIWEAAAAKVHATAATAATAGADATATAR